jgi:hypothetical protein
VFPGQIKKLNIQLCFAPLPFGEPYHSRVRFKCVQLAHLFGVVMNKVCASAYTDFKNFSMGQRDDLLPNFLDGRWITQNIHKIGINMIAIKRHSLFSMTSMFGMGRETQAEHDIRLAVSARPTHNDRAVN